jgi:hypothetical protein
MDSCGSGTMYYSFIYDKRGYGENGCSPSPNTISPFLVWYVRPKQGILPSKHRLLSRHGNPKRSCFSMILLLPLSSNKTHAPTFRVVRRFHITCPLIILDTVLLLILLMLNIIVGLDLPLRTNPEKS